jgi:hypothetical protein
MRHLVYKLALSTALLAGSTALAHAACQQTVASTDTGSFQLAQSGGGSSGGSSGGSGSGSTGGTAGSTTGGTGAGSTAAPGTTSGGGGRTVIPQEQPMRQPATPGAPPQPSPTAPSSTTQPNR